MQVFNNAIRYKDSKEEKNNTFLLCKDVTHLSFIICTFAYRDNHVNRFSNTFPSFVKLFSNTSPSL